MRRAQHDKVEAPNLIPCPNCSAPIVTHRVCATCGYYKGKQIVDVGSASDTTKT